MKYAAVGLIFFTLVTLVQSAAEAAKKEVRGDFKDFDLTDQEEADIKKRAVTVRHRNPRGALNEFFSAGEINSPVNKVFDYYEDHNNTKKFQNAIKELTVVIDERDESSGYRQLKYSLNLPWPIGWRNFVLDLRGKGEKNKWGAIWWSFNEGNINEMMGSYYMRSIGPNKTLLKYHVIADMNTWVPGWLIGFIQRGTIPNVVEAGRRDLE